MLMGVSSKPMARSMAAIERWYISATSAKPVSGQSKRCVKNTNTENAPLAKSVNIDPDGEGILNAYDPTPFFFGSTNMMLTITPTNGQLRLTWPTIPNATNYVLFTTNTATMPWMVLTNFTTPPAPPYAPITAVFYDLIGASQRFYQVRVDPNTFYLYGP